MKNPIFAALLVLCAAPLIGQAPATATTKTLTDPLGFSYSLPADWELLDMQPALPAERQQVEKDATSAEEKRGVECTQVPFLARRGNPPSVIEVLTISYDCLGQKYTDKDLPYIGTGVSGGLKQGFNVIDPVYGAYTLGSHSLWIERAMGNFISNPDEKRELEVVCAILKNGVACWMTFVTDDAALKVFEEGQVVLEGDAPTALVPPDALKRKPQ
jgi:hypothetical protein